MTTNRASQPTNPLQLVTGRTDWRAALEQDYEQVAGRLATAYSRVLPELRSREQALMSEIARIEAETGAPAKTSVVRSLDSYQALMGRIEVEMQDFSAAVRFAAADLRDAAIRSGIAAALDGVAAQSSVAAGAWMQPDPEALARLIGYVDGDAMRAKFARFGANAGQDFADLLLSMTAQGKSARTIAQVVSGWNNVPLAWADNMARTIQAYSYRGATSAAYKANERLLDGWMWQAALDVTTCLSCLSQHGSIHTVDETLDDHYNGRCAMVPIVAGSDWQDDVESGQDWFERQPEAAQRAQAGNLLYTALNNGDAAWSDLSKAHEDSVFGTMLREASVKELVSDNRYISLVREASR